MFKKNRIFFGLAFAHCKSQTMYFDGYVGGLSGHASYSLFHKKSNSSFDQMVFSAFDSDRYEPSSFNKGKMLFSVRLGVSTSQKCTANSDFGSSTDLCLGKSGMLIPSLFFRRNFSKYFVRVFLGATLGVGSLKESFKARNTVIELLFGVTLALEVAVYFLKHNYASVVLIATVGRGRALSIGVNVGATSKPCMV